ncbi:Spt20 family [Penicillium alfredii]|uniref:Spt20 family n=1 Tax=Penicillium alfredii TaxID=1506179 RepID=A0A9W9GAA5_9EURO|nr:Spt20 family [Penicillium alfredii]KAJ5114320.1 Spt20 family [Penicillium alfredii]
MMATAVSKPTSHTPKMKRPPPPFSQAGVNGVKAQQPSSSPPTASKRPPASVPAGMSPNLANGVPNVANPAKGPLSRTRNQSQRPGDPASRMGRPVTRTALMDSERRAGKRFPEPYVKTTPYILKKYATSPPSLIVHLHPTHFRFEQQDGSFPYNSEMKVIIEHIRTGTVPHDLIEELLRSGVRFYEGCLIVRVVDHKSVSAQARKASASSSTENSTPFSLHNYNEHVTPSAFVPYPKQNQLTSDTQGGKPSTQNQSDDQTNDEASEQTQRKSAPPMPRVFTTVLHPTAQTLQAELTLLITTPDPKAARASAPNQLSHTQSSSIVPQSPANGNQSDREPPAKRQKTLVEPQDLPECESKLIRALAPPLFLEPLRNLEGTQDLLKFLESPLHRDPPPSPKRRKRTVAELAADEALAAEEERFMLIMDERLEPTASGTAGASKAAAVDDTGGVAPFEPRFSRFKTLETIRMQHEENAKREHEMKLKQELAKRQQQEQEKERRQVIEQRQAEEHAKEEARRQKMAAQHAQAQLAAQQHNRHVIAQPNGVSQGQQSSPIVRHQTPHSTSSPLVGNSMATQAVPMSITASQGSGSPPRPPSALQHAHPNVMSHPMAPSRSQQGPSRHGTPQMAHGTPAVSHATPIMRNVTPTQRMGHGSPNHSMAQTPVMNQPMGATPQMNGGMGLTPQQQMLLQQRQQQLLAQQGHLGHSQFTPQQLAQMQANAHAQQNIQSHQQQMLQAQQHQQHPQHQQNQPVQKVPQHTQQAYQAQLMRAQYAQMQMVKQQQGQQQIQPQGQQNQAHHGSPQMTPQQQQQQMLMAAAQANGGQVPPNMQGVNIGQRYHHLYQQRLLRLRQEMSQRYLSQYGPPTQYPPQLAQQYGPGLEKNAKAWIQDLMRRDREAAQQHRVNQAAMQAQHMQQQNMMHNGMGN